jgi:hypothetical protein
VGEVKGLTRSSGGGLSHDSDRQHLKQGMSEARNEVVEARSEVDHRVWLSNNG